MEPVESETTDQVGDNSPTPPGDPTVSGPVELGATTERPEDGATKELAGGSWEEEEEEEEVLLDR